jgi:hypothetical protein
LVVIAVLRVAHPLRERHRWPRRTRRSQQNSSKGTSRGSPAPETRAYTRDPASRPRPTFFFFSAFFRGSAAFSWFLGFLVSFLSFFLSFFLSVFFFRFFLSVAGPRAGHSGHFGSGRPDKGPMGPMVPMSPMGPIGPMAKRTRGQEDQGSRLNLENIH